MKEKWKIMEEFPKYLISNKGRIKTLNTLEDKKSFCKGRWVYINGVNKKRETVL